MIALLMLGCAQVSGVHDAPPPGDPSAYEPFQSASAVAAFTGAGSELVRIDAKMLRSDGTMDFGAKYEPYTVYHFLRKTSGDAEMPVGAGGGAGLEKVTVRVGQPGYISITSTGGPGPNVKQNVHHRGMVEVSATPAKPKDREDVVAPPKCKAADLWSRAVAQGAPSDAVASLSYDDHGYNLRIDDVGFRMSFDADCEDGKVRKE